MALGVQSVILDKEKERRLYSLVHQCYRDVELDYLLFRII